MTREHWRWLDRTVAIDASDARLQLHHAAQLATAIGISYLAPQADDSHTNLEWLRGSNALASRVVSADIPFRIAVRPHPFALLALVGEAQVASLGLDGQTIGDAEQWVRRQLAAHPIDADAYTLARHYTIPHHSVDDGAPFSYDARTFEELSHWFADAALVLDELANHTAGASEVRCWPHHFDIGTVISVEPGKSIGIGMEPGDTFYGEPYYYVNLYPAPALPANLPPLSAGGTWRTEDWTGAVLPATSVDDARQKEQITEFIGSALAGCMGLLANSIDG